MAKLCTFMKIGTYFLLFRPVKTQKIKKKISNFFFLIFSWFFITKILPFWPFGLALAQLFWPKVFWAKPWLCPKPIRSHPMQVHWHSIAKNPTKVVNTVSIFWSLKVATFGSIFHLDLGPQNTKLGALGVSESIWAHSSIL